MNKLEEKKNHVILSPGLSQEPISRDFPTYLIVNSCVCLLRSLLVGVGLCATSLRPSITRAASGVTLSILNAGTASGNLQLY